MRPSLLPTARPLWRDEQTVQLGCAGPRSVVLSGVDPAVRRVLALCDGSHDEQQLLVVAAREGCSPARAGRLLTLLRDNGLLAVPVGRGQDGMRADERERIAVETGSGAVTGAVTGAEAEAVTGAARRGSALAARRRANVQVFGAGRVGATVAGLLATAGVGGVDVVDGGPTRPEDTGVGGPALSDVGRSRGDATRAWLRSLAPSVVLAPQPCPDLVVLAPPRRHLLTTQVDALPRGAVHLLAEVRDTVGIVGPMVVPGRSPCLRCLDLTRTGLDPAWPVLAAQLAAPSPSVQPCDAALAQLVAAQAVLQVLTLIDGVGTPASLGGTLELALPDWRVRRRSWPAHVGCDCGASSALPPTG